ncbi:PAS domain S-box [Terriglobus roseus DSM 18391]|uniref:PAS domain S-box n=2 Tax=Terriglobus roseus TaxID=392734 RepID=I3ZGE9_TERRK|nr:PAS domain S-box [Terriglobus roseus DSM 18391]
MSSTPKAMLHDARTPVQAIGRYSLHSFPLCLKDGPRVLALSRRQLDVLAFIARAEGDVVSKSAIFEAVWHGAFVEQGNLTQSIYMIRKAMGKLPDGSEFIQTVSGHGYRLAAALQNPEVVQSFVEMAPSRVCDRDRLHSQEGRFHLMVESIGSYALYMLDCRGQVRSWNLGAERMKGYAASEVLARHFSMFYLPEDVAKRIPDREMWEAAECGRCTGENWHLKKDGGRFWARCEISGMRGPDGKLLGFARIVFDATAEKTQADKALCMGALWKRERDRLHAAAESSMDALLICETVFDGKDEIDDFIFTYLNSNAKKLVISHSESIAESRMSQCFRGNWDVDLFAECKRVALTNHPFIARCSFQAHDVPCRWLRVQVVRIENGVLITASDITERDLFELGGMDCVWVGGNVV